MIKKIQLTPSGISFIDKAWGGFYRGGTYLLIGPHKSGKTLFNLQFTHECIRQQEICLYLTSTRPKDLMINAAAINFDLQHYMNQNKVMVIHVNLPQEKDLEDNSDEHLKGYLQDIISIVEQYQPSKIVFDELTPFICYKDINKLKEVFVQTCEAVEDFGITSLFSVAEPASPSSNRIVDALVENSTGCIYLTKKEKGEDLISGGIITITPNIGHTEGQFKAGYHIQPQEGIVANYQDSSGSVQFVRPLIERKETTYKSLSEIETFVEDYSVTNFYSEKEFRLLLNNQIAYYKSTGKGFILCSILPDKEALTEGLLTLNQLKNSVRLSSDKRDKICVLDDRIIVLVLKEDQKNINNLIVGIKNNLPGTDNEYLNRILKFIYIYSIQVDENINNADDLLKKIFSDKVSQKSNK